MKKIQLAMITASIIGMSATAVNAQSQFEGAYGQLGVGYQGVTPSVSDVRVSLPSLGINNAPLTSSVGTSSNFTGTVTAGYNFSVTKEFLFGVGVDL